ncbi:MAG: DNA-directed RNA polymerase subunit A'' [Candidatus Aenigmarchaeota archaeon ex4484_14]|nr:MAG: DNA-directed RNA polymerase subunit A'' [Candidatus Aenigmarchaeota archaeon ex4484_14]
MTTIKIPKKIEDDFNKFCEEHKIKGSEKKKLYEKLKEIVKKSLFEPGEAVGVITAQSISEPATQMTMRSYTMASQAGRLAKVTFGLPRMVEIFDARKTFERAMKIYLKEEYNNKKDAKRIAEKIKERFVRDVVEKSSIDLLNMQLEFELSADADRDTIKSAIEKYAKSCNVSFRANKLYIKPEKAEIKDLRSLKNKILETHLSGIRNILKVAVVKDGEDWVIQTSGSNLRKILELPEIDIKRTYTNDMYEVEAVLGIEAARNLILNEASSTLSEQGLDVDIRHIMLISDLMTKDGKIRSVGRYGISGKKTSVLAKANFEETLKHLTNASFKGLRDELRGAVENVIIGNVAPVGTGRVELIVDPKKLKKISGKKS